MLSTAESGNNALQAALCSWECVPDDNQGLMPSLALLQGSTPIVLTDGRMWMAGSRTEPAGTTVSTTQIWPRVGEAAGEIALEGESVDCIILCPCPAPSCP
jgi:hypothetical protein